MIAFVRSVARSATLSGDMQYVRSSMSANTGVARWCSTGVAEAFDVGRRQHRVDRRHSVVRGHAVSPRAAMNDSQMLRRCL
jgi:hypothetical protein